jgi:hypothetical protein
MKTSYSQAVSPVNPTRKDGAADGRTAFAVMSPGDSCWKCGRTLAKYPQAVLVERLPLDIFYLVCSGTCAAIVVRNLVATGYTVRLLDGNDAFARFCEASSRTIFMISNESRKAISQVCPTRLTFFDRETGEPGSYD